MSRPSTIIIEQIKSFEAQALQYANDLDDASCVKFNAFAEGLRQALPHIQALEAQLAAIQQAAQPISAALARLHPYIDESSVLEVEIPNADWLTKREAKWIYVELKLNELEDDDHNADALRIRHLQALTATIAGESA
jgi:hypothetical protein